MSCGDKKNTTKETPNKNSKENSSAITTEKLKKWKIPGKYKKLFGSQQSDFKQENK